MGDAVIYPVISDAISNLHNFISSMVYARPDCIRAMRPERKQALIKLLSCMLRSCSLQHNGMLVAVNGPYARPKTMKEYAAQSGLSVANVKHCLADLRSLGYIQGTQAHENGRYSAGFRCFTRKFWDEMGLLELYNDKVANLKIVTKTNSDGGYMPNFNVIGFTSDFGCLHVVIENNTPLFIAKDIARLLGYKCYPSFVYKNCPNKRIIKINAGKRFYVIPRKDLDIVFSNVVSRNCDIDKINEWIENEILPTINREKMDSKSKCCNIVHKQISIKGDKTMNSFIMLFENEDLGKVRVFRKDNFTYFAYVDLLRILDISTDRTWTTRQNIRYESWPSLTSGSGLCCILEEDVYNLISIVPNKDIADKFRNWFDKEIIPTVHKIELLENQKETWPILNYFSDPAAAARAWADEYEAKQKAEEHIKKLETEIENYKEEATKINDALKIADDYKPVTEMVWLNKVFGAKDKAHAFWIALGKLAVQISREMGYEIGKIYDCVYGEVNAYHKDILKELYKRVMEDPDLLSQYRKTQVGVPK